MSTSQRRTSAWNLWPLKTHPTTPSTSRTGGDRRDASTSSSDVDGLGPRGMTCSGGGSAQSTDPSVLDAAESAAAGTSLAGDREVAHDDRLRLLLLQRSADSRNRRRRRSSSSQQRNPFGARVGSPSSPPSPYSGCGRTSTTTDDSPPSTPPDSAGGFSMLAPLAEAKRLPAELVGVEQQQRRSPPPPQSVPASTPTPSRSRNDIFATRQALPALEPAPRPAAATTPPRSRNDLFFGAAPLPPVLPSSRLAAPSPKEGVSSTHRDGSEVRADASTTAASGEHVRPSYGRVSTEERQRERARIRQANDIEFRLCPTRDFVLGEGRHCEVYLGAYRTKRRRGVGTGAARQGDGAGEGGEGGAAGPDASGGIYDDDDLSPNDWRLCAIKRLHADRQSQLLGLDEAFALRRLGGHPHLIQLIGLHDEVELTATTPSASSQVAGAREVTARNQPAPAPVDGQPHRPLLGKGLPTALRVPEHSIHSRSTSDSNALEEVVSAAPSSASIGCSGHRRMASQPLCPMVPTGAPLDTHTCVSPPPVVRIDAPEEETPLEQRRSREAPRDETRAAPPPSGSPPRPALPHTPSSASSGSGDAPRLLLLLELYPFSLSTFARKFPERVDYEQWLTWAKQLAATIEWLHAKGCVHADIKKENVMLTEDLDVKLCDFNSAVFPGPSAVLTDGLGLGTPAYGAPELLTRGGGGGGGGSSAAATRATRSAHPSPNGSSQQPQGFSYGVDIWSLGAVLYSLASGVEPFARARSMVDLLYRKRVFFESEENERVARQSVAEGWESLSSAGGSAAASRSGSLRGRRTAKAPSSSSVARRTAVGRHARTSSEESIESVASSLLASGRRVPSHALRMLLDPSPVMGVLSPESVGGAAAPAAAQQRHPSTATASSAALPSSSPSSSSLSVHHGARNHHHHRATSLGKAHPAATGVGAARPASPSLALGAASGAFPASQTKGALAPSPVVSRPSVLRRTTSYGGIEANAAGVDDDDGDDAGDGGDSDAGVRAEGARGVPIPILAVPTTRTTRSSSMVQGAAPPGSSPGSNVSSTSPSLLLAISAAFANASRKAGAVAAQARRASGAGSGSGDDDGVRVGGEGGEREKDANDGRRGDVRNDEGGRHEDEDEEGGVEEEATTMRAYADGSPAMVLPGGGRLPDAARELLRWMLSTDPRARPDAAQVVRALEAL